jgi:hypothetical protein
MLANHINLKRGMFSGTGVPRLVGSGRARSESQDLCAMDVAGLPQISVTGDFRIVACAPSAMRPPAAMFVGLVESMPSAIHPLDTRIC